MLQKRFVGHALIVLVMTALAGCASAPAGGAANEVAVRVNNNLIPPTSLSVYMVPEVGARRLLGTVPPGSNRTLRYNPVGVGGTYRLVGETVGGTDIPSTPFSLTGAGVVNWDVQSRIATVTDATP